MFRKGNKTCHFGQLELFLPFRLLSGALRTAQRESGRCTVSSKNSFNLLHGWRTTNYSSLNLLHIKCPVAMHPFHPKALSILNWNMEIWFLFCHSANHVQYIIWLYTVYVGGREWKTFNLNLWLDRRVPQRSATEFVSYRRNLWATDVGLWVSWTSLLLIQPDFDFIVPMTQYTSQEVTAPNLNSDYEKLDRPQSSSIIPSLQLQGIPYAWNFSPLSLHRNQYQSCEDNHKFMHVYSVLHILQSITFML